MEKRNRPPLGQGRNDQDNRDGSRRPDNRRPYQPRPERDEDNRDLLVGVHAVLEAIKAGRQIEKVLIEKELPSNERLQELYDLCRRSRIPVQKVPAQALDARAQRHQGTIAYVSPFEYIRLSEAIHRVTEQGIDPFIVILDGVTDTRNAGALARSAECAGAQILVVPMLGTALLGHDAFKSSSGALEHIYVCREADLTKTVPWLQGQGIRVAAITEKANKDLFFADLSGPIALVLGSEDDGIQEDIIGTADVAARLPMMGQIGSLNVSAAGAVACYEVLRQRGTPKD